MVQSETIQDQIECLEYLRRVMVHAFFHIALECQMPSIQNDLEFAIEHLDTRLKFLRNAPKSKVEAKHPTL